MKKSAKYKRLIIILLAGAVFVFLCTLFAIRIVNGQRRTKELEQRAERLEKMIEEEESRRAELDDMEDYVKTKEYIEEKARSIGYVYPDEIIFKEDD